MSDDFKFTIKIPNSITLTHFYSRNNSRQLKRNPNFLSDELINTVLEILESMGKKIGMLMFEFEYLYQQKMSGVEELVEKFEAFTTSNDRHYPIGRDSHNPNFLQRLFFEFVDKKNLSVVFLQGYFVAFICNTFVSYKNYVNSTSVIRLHRIDRAGIEAKTKNI